MARRTGFTLIEILIVVVILTILAAIAVPQFAKATATTATTATLSELAKIRRHIEVFKIRNMGSLPDVTPGDGTWGQIVDDNVNRDYLLSAPVNAWVGGTSAKVIAFGVAPDGAYHRNYGWIYDPANGDVWAAAFDADDNPFPR